jgi:REP element-mobilizing transposase RayT
MIELTDRHRVVMNSAGIKQMKSSSRSAQQELRWDRGHGGARAGAGRKPGKGRRRVAHVERPVVKPSWPVHVTVRMRADVPRLRNFKLVRVLRRAFVKGCQKDRFRICQFSIQGNHIHTICEADDRERLARGVQGWCVRIARGVNRVVGRTGSLFGDRYHVEVITSPRQMRHTLCYVLLNARRHNEQLDARYHGMDPFSSAWWFDGWADDRWRQGLEAPDPESPVAPAASWLLKTGWRRHRKLAIDEVPAAARRD